MANETQGADASDMAARESEPQIMMLDDRLVGPHLEIASPRVGVSIQVNDKRVWVNVDGICRLRICGAHEIEVEVDGKKVRR